MADIELVIKIDEEMYAQIIDENGMDTMLIPYSDIIRSGKPLPKGHGRLIDASNLFTVTDIKNDGSEFTYIPYSEIEDVPTIIEADKVESEDKE